MVKALIALCVILGAVLVSLGAYWFYQDIDFYNMSPIDKGTVVVVILTFMFSIVMALTNIAGDPIGTPKEEEDNEELPKSKAPRMKAKPGRIKEVEWL